MGCGEGRSRRVIDGARRQGLRSAVTRNGKRILSGGEDKIIRVWDVEAHEQNEVWGSHSGDIFRLALSPDDRLAASGVWDGKIVIRQMKEGREMKDSIDAGGGVHSESLSFSPNGEKLTSAVNNYLESVYLIQVYKIDSGKLVGPIKAHQSYVNCVRWSVDGGQLFSASSDRTIRCWDPERAESIAGPPWTGHIDDVTAVSLSPDGTNLASVSLDKTVCFWDITKIADLRHH